MPLHLRADDGIRTRDPHLGKVMRYQLRYIRVPRSRSSPVAMQNDSPPGHADTNPLLATVDRRCPMARVGGAASRRSGGAQASPGARFRRSQPGVLVFCLVESVGFRSRSSVGERPPHTRKVAGSKPAGTTTKPPGSRGFRVFWVDRGGCLMTHGDPFQIDRPTATRGGPSLGHAAFLRRGTGDGSERRRAIGPCGVRGMCVAANVNVAMTTAGTPFGCMSVEWCEQASYGRTWAPNGRTWRAGVAQRGG